MKVVLRIAKPDRYKENAAAEAAFVQFCEAVGLEWDCLYTSVEQTDPRARQLIELLAAHGFSLKPDHVRADQMDRLRHVMHYTVPVFEKSDWDAAEYLRLEPKEKVDYDHLRRQPEGDLVMWWKHVPQRLRNVDFVRSADAGMDCLVAERAHDLLESAGLRKLRLSPVRVVILTKKEPAANFWEVDSEVTLPPVSESVPVYDGRDRLLPPGGTGIGWRIPRPPHGIWRYTRRAIESVPAFDIARTHEPWGHLPHRPDGPRNDLVVSRRFYEVCVRHNIKGYWIPVVIDPE